MKKNSYSVYTCGKCNDKQVGTYGAVIVDNDTGETLMLHGKQEDSTVNRMEIIAVITALSRIEQRSVVDLYASSEYILNTIDGKYKKKKNLDLWSKLDSVSKGKTVVTHFIRRGANDFVIKSENLCDFSSDLKDDTVHTAKSDFQSSKKAKKLFKSKWDSMNKKIKIPKEYMYYSGIRRNTSKKAQESVDILNSVEKPTYKQYRKAVVGGKDEWSTVTDPEKIADPECIAIVDDFFKGEHFKTIQALRWYGRGLSLDKAIRKILIEYEFKEKLDEQEYIRIEKLERELAKDE